MWVFLAVLVRARPQSVTCAMGRNRIAASFDDAGGVEVSAETFRWFRNPSGEVKG